MRSTVMYLGERLEAYFVGVHNIELLEIQLLTFLFLNQVFFPLWGFFQVKSEPRDEGDRVFPRGWCPEEGCWHCCSSCFQAELHTGTLPQIQSTALRGEKLHRIFHYVLDNLVNVMNGYCLPEPYFSSKVPSCLFQSLIWLHDRTVLTKTSMKNLSFSPFLLLILFFTLVSTLTCL